MNPRIAEATPIENYRVLLRFTNGETGTFDCAPLLDFGVFQELRDKHYFNRVKVSDGAIVWPNDQDISPDTLYLESQRHAIAESVGFGAV